MTTNEQAASPSRAFVENLLSEHPELRDDLHGLAAAAWKAGAESQRRRGTNALVKDYAVTNAALMRKIERVRDVLRNTVNKVCPVTPTEFVWTMDRGPLAICGIQRNMGARYSQRRDEILKDVAAGKTDFRSTDSIILHGAGHYNKDLSVLFPAHWFSMSDGDLAKMARAQVREAAERQKNKTHKDLLVRRAALEKALAKLNATIESHR